MPVRRAEHGFQTCGLAVVSLGMAASAAQTPPPTVTPEMRGDIFMARKMYREAAEAYKEGPRDSAVLLNKIAIAYHQMNSSRWRSGITGSRSRRARAMPRRSIIWDRILRAKKLSARHWGIQEGHPH